MDDVLGRPTSTNCAGCSTAGAIKALKIYPGYEPFYPADAKLAPAYELAEAFDVPVMIHSGDTYAPRGKVKYSHPLHVDDVAVDFPRVKFLICHLGNPWFRDCMEVVYKNDNVYTDISGLVLGNFTDRFEAYMRQQFKEMVSWGINPAEGALRHRLADLVDGVVPAVHGRTAAAGGRPRRDAVRERRPAVQARRRAAHRRPALAPQAASDRAGRYASLQCTGSSAGPSAV